MHYLPSSTKTGPKEEVGEAVPLGYKIRPDAARAAVFLPVRPVSLYDCTNHRRRWWKTC
jgi:hypothetical protein